MTTSFHNLAYLHKKRTMQIVAAAILACVFFAAPVSASTIQFTPDNSGSGAGVWEYDGAGTLTFPQDIAVDVAFGSGVDALVGASVFLPDLSVGGIPGGPYTVTPDGAGTITIKSSDNTKTYLTGTLGPGDLFPIGTTGLMYTNFQVDITNVNVTDDGKALGSAALDAIESSQCPFDFELTLQGAGPSGFKSVLDSNTVASAGFSASMTEKCPDCQLDVTKEGCVVLPAVSDCEGKVTSMILEYTGLGCDASSHSQDPKKAKCEGDPSLAEPVDIFATDKKGKKNWASVLDVPVGGVVLVDAANAGKDTLDADTIITIFDSTSGDELQEIKMHTSCSQPLNIGDQFGSLRVLSYTSSEGGVAGGSDSNTCVTELPGTGLSFDVEYTYTIMNTGPTGLTNVTVIDDLLGPVPGSPIAALAPGETVVLTATTSLSSETTNTVVVMGEVGNDICTADANATITKAPPVCETKVKAMLLEYIGPTVAGPVTVEFKADKFKEDPTIYGLAGDLVAGTVLSSPAENDWSIDGTAHGLVELGAKTSILINGVTEVIHTSCSTDFVAGQPAPLDNPKGDPSTNWFVVDFIQK